MFDVTIYCDGLENSPGDCVTETIPVPDTNATFCVDDYNYINCPLQGEAFFGQDATLLFGTEQFEELWFNDNTETILVDNFTGRVWTRFETSIQLLDEAAQYCSSLNDVGYGGQTGWRVPTAREYSSLLGQTGEMSVPWTDPFAFGDFSYGYFVTSDMFPPVLGAYLLWATTTFGISPYTQDDVSMQDVSLYTHCISSPIAMGAYATVAPSFETFKHDTTGLQWTRELAPESSWQDALQYCADLETDGYPDWRLPSVRELSSLLDYARSQPVPQSMVPVQDQVWTSSPASSGEGTLVHVLDLATPWAIYDYADSSHAALCVRGGTLEPEPLP
jgi:hypothetical protein